MFWDLALVHANITTTAGILNQQVRLFYVPSCETQTQVLLCWDNVCDFSNERLFSLTVFKKTLGSLADMESMET